MNKRLAVYLIIVALMTASCLHEGKSNVSNESLEAKAMMQGIWLDDESGDIVFHINGDTIYYSDSTSMPAFFRIVEDSLVLASGTKYGIVKQTEHLFWFKNQSGDIVKLVKSDNTDDEKAFVHDTPKTLTYTHQVKTDSIVMYNGERYHWYIAINPTKYKVTKRSYTDDGIEVENAYFDNIMHLSVFHGAQRLYSCDFRKQMYGSLVPEGFLKEAILGNMEYSHVDNDGLHFNATICIPDGASCYLVESIVSYNGHMTMKVIEY